MSNTYTHIQGCLNTPLTYDVHEKSVEKRKKKKYQVYGLEVNQQLTKKPILILTFSTKVFNGVLFTVAASSVYTRARFDL